MRYFVVRGFGVKKDSAGQEVDFDRVDRELIAPALARCGFEGGTTAQMKDAGSIHSDMFELILEADVVVCDITVHNANVFYELGIRHALRKKHTVLIKGRPSADTTPFDIAGWRYLNYDVSAPAQTVDDLVDTIKAGIDGDRETDSPVFRLMPSLPEARPPNAVPTDFAQEVQRARAASDKGWLLMLAQDVRNQRFEWDGLRAVARAQWKLKDYEFARQNWETLLERDPRDAEALLALGNLYERLSRQSDGDVDLLSQSDEAIATILALPDLELADRAEALALFGRNLKTRWRAELTGATLDERIAQACDKRLLKAYQAYRDAFEIDLNACFPGIAGLHLGAILLVLAQSPSWSSLFDDEDEAAASKVKLKREWAELQAVVRTSIRRAKKTATGDALVWAAISDADLLFVSEDEAAQAAKPDRLIKAYKDAMPKGNSFEWDATRGQLELFALLGIRATAAQAVIAKLEETRPLPAHVVVFAGHTIDRSDRPLPRFPPSTEAQARELIRTRLLTHQQASAGAEVVVLASMAPGADILVHEVCRELGLRSVVCLPMPQDVVARLAFTGIDDGWRNRMLTLLELPGMRPRVLQTEAELPRWLRQRAPDPWERGNRWVISTARAWDAERRTLLALWDGDDAGGATGGTAHLVRLARDAGLFVDRIDSRALLG
ncbi:MAG: hypothetical protein EOP39_02055 [Rubrivivax sp.]|nr:MAG: hypothetical protein EOP39_02055 [Rubrivivax sp.]